MTRTYIQIAVLALVALALLTPGCAGVDKKDEELMKQAQWHYDMGAGYFESNEIPLAIRELSFALEKNPNHEQSHYVMGFIYMGRRNYNKAIYHFRETLRLNPSYHFAKNNLGTVYMATGRWQDAEEIFLELLDEPLYMTPELAHNNLGWTYYNLKRNSEAVEQLKMAVFLKPEFCLGYNNLGLAYEAMGNRVESVSMYRRSIELCPTNYAEPHFNLGRLLQEQRDPKAKAHFRRCIEIGGHSTLASRCRQFLQVQ